MSMNCRLLLLSRSWRASRIDMPQSTQCDLTWGCSPPNVTICGKKAQTWLSLVGAELALELMEALYPANEAKMVDTIPMYIHSITRNSCSTTDVCAGQRPRSAFVSAAEINAEAETTAIASSREDLIELIESACIEKRCVPC